MQEEKGKAVAAEIGGVFCEVNVTDDGSVDAVIAAIKASAVTGKIGDGKIWVANIDRLVRIRTGEEGPDAI